MTASTSDITRRDFVRTSALVVGSAAVGAAGGCGATDPPEPTALVAATRGNNLDTMTRDVLEGVGGIGRVVHEGETVFIKPNMVTLPWARTSNRFIAGECTKPEIIIAVAEECLRAGAAEVIIGDGSQMPTLDWTLATTLDGSTNLVREAARLSSSYAGQVRVASLEADSPDWVELPSRTYLGTIAVSSLVARADRVISIPVAKTHTSAQLTLSLKNFVGVTSLERYGMWMEAGYWDRGRVLDHSSARSIAEIYLDIVDGVKPDLAIIDNGTRSLVVLSYDAETGGMRERIGWRVYEKKMHEAVIVVALQLQGRLEPEAHRGLGIGVVRPGRVQAEKDGDQGVGQVGQRKSPVGRGEQGGEGDDEEVLQKPIEAIGRCDRGDQPDDAVTGRQGL